MFEKWKSDHSIEDFIHFPKDSLEAVKLSTDEVEVYHAPFGDFLKEYIKHVSSPWWRRGKKWKEIEEKMRNILNDTETITWYRRKNKN